MIVYSDSGQAIPDSFYSSGWNDLSNNQNTHGFFSTPNSTNSNFNSFKSQESTKMFFDTATQTNFQNQSLLPPVSTTKDSTKISDLDIINSSSNDKNPWPVENSVLQDLPETNIETKVEEPLDSAPSELINLPEFNSVTGMVAGTLNNSIMGGLNQQNYTKTMQGNGPMQGDFNSQRTAQLTLDNRNIASSVSSTIISASSLLGPEAFAAGTIIGAGIDIATEMGAFDSTPAPVNTN
jgi:hypothetical protein